ncbi:MAG: hypothetical protein AVDCRST_MAG59-653, partial [uncultured Thermomicrobiales bacterium]
CRTRDRARHRSGTNSGRRRSGRRRRPARPPAARPRDRRDRPERRAAWLGRAPRRVPGQGAGRDRPAARAAPGGDKQRPWIGPGSSGSAPWRGRSGIARVYPGPAAALPVRIEQGAIGGRARQGSRTPDPLWPAVGTDFWGCRATACRSPPRPVCASGNPAVDCRP